MDISYNWQDDECAEVSSLKCDCGNVIIEKEVAYDNKTVECGKCGRKYKFVWRGLTVDEIKE